MLRLRPHHILDIVRNIGNDRQIVPHEYGHLVHEITLRILQNVDAECLLVIENDDVCGPCRMLTKDGRCIDLLHQLEYPVAKQSYNDDLDSKILAFLNILPNTVLRINDYLSIMNKDINRIVDICTHPKEDKEYRKNGIVKGMKILGIE